MIGYGVLTRGDVGSNMHFTLDALLSAERHGLGNSKRGKRGLFCSSVFFAASFAYPLAGGKWPSRIVGAALLCLVATASALAMTTDE